MCVVSMVTDHYYDKWKELKPPQLPGYTYMPSTNPVPWPITITTPVISQEEIDEFRRLLERAREYDKRNNEPDCELEEKKLRVKKLADELGIKIDFL